MPKIHELKTWPTFFEGIKSGKKPFELRKNDRDYHAGDWLRLREWNPEPGEYTGREALVFVTYALHNHPGITAGYSILGIEQETIVLLAADHPGADHRQPKHGEQEFILKVPLERQRWLLLRMGRERLKDVLAVVTAEANEGKPEPYRDALAALMPFVLDDYYPDCATPEFKEAVEKAKGLLGESCPSPLPSNYIEEPPAEIMEPSGNMVVDPAEPLEVVWATVADAKEHSMDLFVCAGEHGPFVMAPWLAETAEKKGVKGPFVGVSCKKCGIARLVEPTAADLPTA